MNDEAITAEPQGEEAGVVRGIQKNLVSLFFLSIAGIAFIVLVYYGAYNNPEMQAILIWIIMGLIAVAIIMMMREKLMMMIILYVLFASVYAIEGAVIHTIGMGEWFSWGVITFALISIFVYWSGLARGFQYKHIYVFIIFIVAAWLINIAGWMSIGNAYAGEAMARLAGGLKGVVVW